MPVLGFCVQHIRVLIFRYHLKGVMYLHLGSAFKPHLLAVNAVCIGSFLWLLYNYY